MQKDQKIYYLVTGLDISGGIAVVLQHVVRLRERGYDAGVLVVSDEAPRDTLWFGDVDIPVMHVLPDKMKEVGSVDVVIATYNKTVKYLEKINAKRKMYFVQSDERRFNLSPEDFHEAELSYKADVEYMTEAKWIQRWLKEEFGHDAYYVPNGLDEILFYPTQKRQEKREKMRILLEGPICIPFKGMQDAYSAVKDLDCELWIVSSGGEPPKEWRYDQFFASVPMHEMKEIYSQCDIFLKMSRVEGFFGPPLEAMACECAVVVGKCTGYDEYIVHEKNALVVEQQDIEGAKKAVQKLIEDQDLHRSLIENGKETAAKWSWDRSIDYLEKAVKQDGVVVHYTNRSPERYDYGKVIAEVLRGIIASINMTIESSRGKSIFAAYSDLQMNNLGLANEIEEMKSSSWWKIRGVFLHIKNSIVALAKNPLAMIKVLVEKYFKKNSIPVTQEDFVTDKAIDPKTIVEKYGGIMEKTKENLVVFAHYNQRSRIDDYVVYYVAQLARFCDVVFVSSAEKLGEEEIKKVEKYCHKIIVKNNVGYDFHSWKVGLESVRESYKKYEQVIFANDSVFGPLYDLAEICETMKVQYDVWGITDHYMFGYHLQSYFVAYGRRPIQEGFLDRFLDEFEILVDKDQIIHKYEVGMSRKMMEYGYHIGTLCTYQEVIKEALYEGTAYDEVLMNSVVNQAHVLWKNLIVFHGCPFLKRELLQKNPFDIDVSDVYSVIEHHSAYDGTMIQKYLEQYSHEGK